MAFAAFVALTSAAALPGEEWECKPLLQSCAVNSECCGDLCVAGVCTSRYSRFFIIADLDDL